jgi:hypothetical protein
MNPIDPTEILVEEKRKILPAIDFGWTRLFARLFDYAIIYAAGHFIPLFSNKFWIPWQPLVWIPIEAFLLTTWGSTPGKYLLHLKVTPKLSFRDAWKRSVLVWFRGMGMGIIFLEFFCLANAYQKLRLFKTTSWDRDCRTQILQGPLTQARFAIIALLAILGLWLY